MSNALIKNGGLFNFGQFWAITTKLSGLKWSLVIQVCISKTTSSKNSIVQQII